MNIKPGKLLIGPLSPNGTGAHVSLIRPTFSLPDKVCNASAPQAEPGEITRIMTGVQRAGSEQFRQYRSRGIGC